MTINKECSKCRLIKPHGARRNSTQTNGYCLECSRKYSKTNYERRKSVIAENKKARIANHRSLIDAKKNVPCQDCGQTYPPYVMQFDHVSGIKEFTIGEVVGRLGLSRVLAEIEKCEVVCANCHAARTWIRKNNSSV